MEVLKAALHSIEMLVQMSSQLFMSSQFNLIRVLDDLVLWDGNMSMSDAMEYAKKIDYDLLCTALRIAHLASNIDIEIWFGTEEDTVKLITNILFATDWCNCVKRNTS